MSDASQRRSFRAVIVIVSDRGFSGERPDATAPRLAAALAAKGIVAEPDPTVVPDERRVIVDAIRAAGGRAELVLTSGGTGLSPRDVTPEATREVIERELPGFGEAMRAVSRAKTPFADLSRAIAGSVGNTLVVNLPGSPNGALECLEAVLPAIPHALKSLAGAVSDCQTDAPPPRRP